MAPASWHRLHVGDVELEAHIALNKANGLEVSMGDYFLFGLSSLTYEAACVDISLESPLYLKLQGLYLSWRSTPGFSINWV